LSADADNDEVALGRGGQVCLAGAPEECGGALHALNIDPRNGEVAVPAGNDDGIAIQFQRLAGSESYLGGTGAPFVEEAFKGDSSGVTDRTERLEKVVIGAGAIAEHADGEVEEWLRSGVPDDVFEWGVRIERVSVLQAADDFFFAEVPVADDGVADDDGDVIEIVSMKQGRVAGCDLDPVDAANGSVEREVMARFVDHCNGVLHKNNLQQHDPRGKSLSQVSGKATARTRAPSEAAGDSAEAITMSCALRHGADPSIQVYVYVNML